MEKIQRDLLELRGEVLGLKQLILQLTPPASKFITAEEAMDDILKCSRNTFDRLRQEGIIKVYRLKRRLYVKQAELLQAIEQGEVQIQQ